MGVDESRCKYSLKIPYAISGFFFADQVKYPAIFICYQHGIRLSHSVTCKDPVCREFEHKPDFRE
jgi:hypothetical protein